MPPCFGTKTRVEGNSSPLAVLTHPDAKPGQLILSLDFLVGIHSDSQSCLLPNSSQKKEFPRICFREATTPCREE